MVVLLVVPLVRSMLVLAVLKVRFFYCTTTQEQFRGLSSVCVLSFFECTNVRKCDYINLLLFFTVYSSKNEACLFSLRRLPPTLPLNLSSSTQCLNPSQPGPTRSPSSRPCPRWPPSLSFSLLHLSQVFLGFACALATNSSTCPMPICVIMISCWAGGWLLGTSFCSRDDSRVTEMGEGAAEGREAEWLNKMLTGGGVRFMGLQLLGQMQVSQMGTQRGLWVLAANEVMGRQQIQY